MRCVLRVYGVYIEWTDRKVKVSNIRWMTINWLLEVKWNEMDVRLLSYIVCTRLVWSVTSHLDVFVFRACNEDKYLVKYYSTMWLNGKSCLFEVLSSEIVYETRFTYLSWKINHMQWSQHSANTNLNDVTFVVVVMTECTKRDLLVSWNFEWQHCELNNSAHELIDLDTMGAALHSQRLAYRFRSARISYLRILGKSKQCVILLPYQTNSIMCVQNLRSKAEELRIPNKKKQNKNEMANGHCLVPFSLVALCMAFYLFLN